MDGSGAIVTFTPNQQPLSWTWHPVVPLSVSARFFLGMGAWKWNKLLSSAPLKDIPLVRRSVPVSCSLCFAFFILSLLALYLVLGDNWKTQNSALHCYIMGYWQYHSFDDYAWWWVSLWLMFRVETCMHGGTLSAKVCSPAQCSLWLAPRTGQRSVRSF